MFYAYHGNLQLPGLNDVLDSILWIRACSDVDVLSKVTDTKYSDTWCSEVYFRDQLTSAKLHIFATYKAGGFPRAPHSVREQVSSCCISRMKGQSIVVRWLLTHLTGFGPRFQMSSDHSEGWQNACAVLCDGCQAFKNRLFDSKPIRKRPYCHSQELSWAGYLCQLILWSLQILASRNLLFHRGRQCLRISL